MLLANLKAVQLRDSLLRGGEEQFQLLLVIFVEIVKVFDLVAMGLVFTLARLGIFANDIFDLLLE